MSRNWKRPDLAEGKKPDYNVVFLTWRGIGAALGKALGLTTVFAWVFYRSWLGMALLPAMIYFCIRWQIKSQKQKCKKRLSLQFRDTILSVTACLQTGHSPENAFIEAQEDICKLYGKESEMAKELSWIRQGLSNRVPLEQLLLSFGNRSHVEEIQDFTEVFAVAKRAGGNLREIIRRTVELTRQRLEVEQEIQERLASRRLEMRIMHLIPFLLYGYIYLSSPGFFDTLYYNPLGVGVMTLCFLVYMSAFFLSEKLSDIRI